MSYSPHAFGGYEPTVADPTLVSPAGVFPLRLRRQVERQPGLGTQQPKERRRVSSAGSHRPIRICFMVIFPYLTLSVER